MNPVRCLVGTPSFPLLEPYRSGYAVISTIILPASNSQKNWQDALSFCCSLDGELMKINGGEKKKRVFRESGEKSSHNYASKAGLITQFQSLQTRLHVKRVALGCVLKCTSGRHTLPVPQHGVWSLE